MDTWRRGRGRPPGPATVRAALVAAAAAVLFGGLAAVGVAAGAALTAGPRSPSLPPALAPRPARPAPTTPASSLAIQLTNGDGVMAVTAAPRARAGRPARDPGPPPGRAPADRHRHAVHGRPEQPRHGDRRVNAAGRERAHLPDTRGAPLAR